MSRILTFGQYGKLCVNCQRFPRPVFNEFCVPCKRAVDRAHEEADAAGDDWLARLIRREAALREAVCEAL